MTRIYSAISKVSQLKELEEKAQNLGTRAVGFTKSGNIYVYDEKSKKTVLITAEEAAQILSTTLEEIIKIVESNGTYQIPNEAKIEEIKEESSNETEASQEQVQEVQEKENTLTRIETKVDMLTEKVDKVLKNIEEDGLE